MFVVAHFHFTLVGGGVFGFLAGVYYWFPKMTGTPARREPWRKLHFWLFEIGFLGVVHAAVLRRASGRAALAGVHRPEVRHRTTLISSLFAVADHRLGRGVRLQHPVSRGSGARVAEANRGAARTLEWMTPSPVPLDQLRARRRRHLGSVRLRERRPAGDGGLQPAMAGGSADAAAVARGPRCRRGGGGPRVPAAGAALMILSGRHVRPRRCYMGYIYLRRAQHPGAVQAAAEPTPTTLGKVLRHRRGDRRRAASGRWGYRASRARQRRGGARAGVIARLAVCTAAGLVAELVVFVGLQRAAAAARVRQLDRPVHPVPRAGTWSIALVIGAIVLGRLCRGPDRRARVRRSRSSAGGCGTRRSRRRDDGAHAGDQVSRRRDRGSRRRRRR